MKKIIKIVFVALLGVTVGYNVYLSQDNKTALSEMMLNNVEALAGEGSGIDWHHHKKINKNGNECCESGWAHYDCPGRLNAC